MVALLANINSYDNLYLGGFILSYITAFFKAHLSYHFSDLLRSDADDS